MKVYLQKKQQQDFSAPLLVGTYSDVKAASMFGILVFKPTCGASIALIIASAETLSLILCQVVSILAQQKVFLDLAGICSSIVAWYVWSKLSDEKFNLVPMSDHFSWIRGTILINLWVSSSDEYLFVL